MKKSKFEKGENDLVWDVVEETYAKDYPEIKHSDKTFILTKKRKKGYHKI